MQKHFTATAFVVDARKRVLLMWHEHMQRWLPPGGHIDRDETPEDAVRRECKEETGLDIEIVGDAQLDLFVHCPGEGRMLKKPMAMLLENIPPFDGAQGKAPQPAHQHMDFLFLARPLDASQELRLEKSEGRELRWFTREEIEELPGDQMFGNVRKYALSTLKPLPLAPSVNEFC